MKKFPNTLSHILALCRTCVFAVLWLGPVTLLSQEGGEPALVFDFNDHQLSEKESRLQPKGVGVTFINDRFGNENSAVYIHGHSHSYLNLGTSALLKPRQGTISLWVKPDRRVFEGKGNAYNPVISTRNGPQADFNIAYCLLFFGEDNCIAVSSSKDSLKSCLVIANEHLTFHKWYHLAFTFDDNYLSLYVNGKLQLRSVKPFESTYNPDDSVMVGHTADKKNERYMLGIVDDIRIYHRVLTEKEIQALYNAPNPNRAKRILFYVLRYAAIVIFFIVVILLILRRNQQKLKKQKEELELAARIAELELKAVKAQINPHFISNCLVAIQELIYTNHVSEAGQYLAKFSYFLRQMLRFSDKNYIPLLQEIELMKLYVELEQLRFRNEFELQLTVADATDPEDFQIPSLVTQPFIENAIWHGLLPLGNIRKAILRIHVFSEAGRVVIEIEDNGVGRKPGSSVSKNSKGIRLIEDKIKNLNYLNGSHHNKIEISDLVDEHGKALGTKVRIQLENVYT